MTSDLNLYAQWNTQTYTITWNPNYDGATSETWQRNFGVQLEDLPTATRNGYAQSGWWTASTGGTEIGSSTTVRGDVTYYAHWNAIPYTIAYELNGGSVSSANPTSYTVETDTFTLNNPTKTGTTFLGWNGSNGTTPELAITISKGSTGNKDFNAVWEANNYVVKFDANGGSSDEPMPDQTFEYGVYQRLSENTYANGIVVTFDGNGGTASESQKTSLLEFLGWARSKTGNVEFTDKQNVRNITTESEVTLYAKWGAAQAMYLPNAARYGYTFANWFTEAIGGNDKGGYNATYIPTAETTLYAHWRANEYTVTFNPTLGSVSPTSKQVTFAQPYGSLPTPTNAEYDFLGWFTMEEGGSQVVPATAVELAEDHVLYAHWKDGMMTLTFDPNDGDLSEDVPETRRCRCGQAFGELPMPTRDGYDFIGWFDDLESDDPQEITSSTIAPEQDMTIYADWMPIRYIIRYHANGGSGTMADQ